MNRMIPVTLWLLVLAVGVVVTYFAFQRRETRVPPNARSAKQPGAAYVDVPWEHLPGVSRFQLTNQDGEVFDTADISGRPMTISFFFANCPTICRDLNKQVRSLREQLDDPEMMFATISVDPDSDTPEVLNRYAGDFGAETGDWNFLTGPLYKVKEIGSTGFRVSVDKDTHTDNILLVDRWGRYRDRFKWDDPYDMKRFLEVAREVLAEKEPPFGKVITTRNVLAGLDPPDIDDVPWIHEFHLTDQESQPFFSRDLTGNVWIGSFFFVDCPGICVEQNQYLSGLQSRLKDHPAQMVSITTNPKYDNPAKMKTYARKFSADLDQWTFLTGDEDLIERISAEYFRAYSSGGHHSTLLFVVDRWGNVRGEFDWREPAAEIQMLELIDQLNAEDVPPAEFQRLNVQKFPERVEPDAGH